MSESEWTKILRWPGYRVYRSVINEGSKTLCLEPSAAFAVCRAVLSISLRTGVHAAALRLSIQSAIQLKENNTRKGFLEPAQYDRLARECAKYGLWMRTLFELAYTYGWRRGELLSLRVNQISIADRTIRLNPGETKNDQGREVTMTPLLRQLLQESIKGKQSDDSALTRKDGKPVGDFRGSWETATKNAEVAGLLFHDLRRTAVRNMIRAGIPERVAMQISDHKTRSIFDRYNVVSQADIQEAVAKLSQRTVRVERKSTKQRRPPRLLQFGQIDTE